MSGRIRCLVLVSIVASTAALADDLTGVDRILCTAVQATRCSMDGECSTAPPWSWNIPQFIEVDLKQKQLATTAASGENRVTPIGNVARDGGVIYLQGVEGGRAFSFAINEATGSLSVAVATKDGATTVIGACTPR